MTIARILKVGQFDLKARGNEGTIDAIIKQSIEIIEWTILGASKEKRLDLANKGVQRDAEQVTTGRGRSKRKATGKGGAAPETVVATVVRPDELIAWLTAQLQAVPSKTSSKEVRQLAASVANGVSGANLKERNNLTTFFDPGKFAASGLDRSTDFAAAMQTIDDACPEGLSAYHRLVAFTRRAVEVHNRGILGKTKRVTIGHVAQKDVLPYISIENTFLPALVEVFERDILSDAPTPWIIVKETVAFMLSGDNVDRLPVCFPQSNDPMFSKIAMDLKYDLFEFDEKIFLESLSTAKPPTEIVDLRRALLDVPDDGFTRHIQFALQSPPACILLLLFECPPLGADRNRPLLPDARGAPQFRSFLLAYLRKDEGRRLEELDHATASAVKGVLRAIVA